MDNIIYITTLLNCAPSRAFTFFTVNELLEKWLTVEAIVEPVPGGRFELFWNPENKQSDSTMGCKITAIEQGKFLAFEWKGPRQFEHFTNYADPLTHVVVFFIPEGNQTHVYLIHSGWRNTPEWEEARQWFVNAWQMSFETLRSLANKPGDS